MNETAKYMTLEECRRYKELAAKHKEPVLFAMSLPCVELPSQVKVSQKRKPRKKRSARR
jgi:hypothetical protein